MPTAPRTDAALLAVVRASLASVAPEADLTSLGLDDDIVETLDLDSMDVLNVMAGVADRTGIEVPERHYPRTRTLRGFVAELHELAGST
jgi:acyl carrier protein